MCFEKKRVRLKQKVKEIYKDNLKMKKIKKRFQFFYNTVHFLKGPRAIRGN